VYLCVSAGGFLSEIGGVCRVNGNLNLSRAIGDLKYKGNTELPPKDQIITAQPDVIKISLQVGGAVATGERSDAGVSLSLSFSAPACMQQCRWPCAAAGLGSPAVPLHVCSSCCSPMQPQVWVALENKLL